MAVARPLRSRWWIRARVCSSSAAFAAACSSQCDVLSRVCRICLIATPTPACDLERLGESAERLTSCQRVHNHGRLPESVNGKASMHGRRGSARVPRSLLGLARDSRSGRRSRSIERFSGRRGIVTNFGLKHRTALVSCLMISGRLAASRRPRCFANLDYCSGQPSRLSGKRGSTSLFWLRHGGTQSVFSGHTSQTVSVAPKISCGYAGYRRVMRMSEGRANSTLRSALAGLRQ